MVLLRWMRRRAKRCCMACCGVIVFIIASIAIYGHHLYKKEQCNDVESKQVIEDLVCSVYVGLINRTISVNLEYFISRSITKYPCSDTIINLYIVQLSWCLPRNRDAVWCPPHNHGVVVSTW